MAKSKMQYRAAGKSSYEAMVQADAEFVRRATEAARDGSDDWDFTGERQFLQAVLNLAADATHKTTEVQLQAASQQQTAMAFLQSQQQMIQQHADQQAQELVASGQIPPGMEGPSEPTQDQALPTQ